MQGQKGDCYRLLIHGPRSSIVPKQPMKLVGPKPFMSHLVIQVFPEFGYIAPHKAFPSTAIKRRLPSLNEDTTHSDRVSAVRRGFCGPQVENGHFNP